VSLVRFEGHVAQSLTKRVASRDGIVRDTMNTLLNLALAATATAILTLVAGCGSATNQGTDEAPHSGSAVSNETVVITAATITALPAGKDYLVDLGRTDLNYDFSFGAAPIDFSRVTIRLANGQETPATAWLAQLAEGGSDLLAQHPEGFLIAPAPEDPVAGGVQPEEKECRFCILVCPTNKPEGPCTPQCWFVPCGSAGGGGGGTGGGTYLQ
jgi:hypothetical protein